MKKVLFVIAILGIMDISAGAWAATPAPFVAPSGAFQMHYASNLTVGDSFINLSNAGSSLSPINPTGDICVNTYVFSPDEQMIECCSCLVTPDGLNSYSVQSDLISNPLIGATPSSVVVKLVANAPNSRNQCNPSTPSTTNLTTGMVAWGTALHATPVAGTYDVTEQEFTSPSLSAIELSNLASQCRFIQNTGSGAGICRNCRTGGQ